jgi:putative transposase
VREIVGDGEVSKAVVATLVTRWGLSRASVWRRLRRYRQDGNLRTSLDGPRGARPEITRTVEDIINNAARDWWKQTENATVAEIRPTVVDECIARQLSPPSRATVARRLAQLRRDPSNFVGNVAATLREKTRLAKSSYTVTEPLAVVQIDHTVADIFVGDPITRHCIGRPTTLCHRAVLQGQQLPQQFIRTTMGHATALRRLYASGPLGRGNLLYIGRATRNPKPRHG